ncbi:MAG: DNA-binding protein [Alphaproteobacteria bacterium]|nr:DNA-binding protein [Alphaproteobacteria bacterium]
MALFFDQGWFDARLAERHLRREDLGALLGLDAEAVAEIWKDQRELKAADVAVIAALLNVPAAEVAGRAGISTPVPRQAAGEGDIAARLVVIEAKLDEILRRLG